MSKEYDIILKKDDTLIYSAYIDPTTLIPNMAVSEFILPPDKYELSFADSSVSFSSSKKLHLGIFPEYFACYILED